jgi:hypothetical protein
MQLCIQDYVSMKRDLENTVLSFRLTPSEAKRFWQIMDDAKRRNPYINKTDVIRELCGLTKPVALSPKEIAAFRSAEESGILTTEITTKAPKSKRRLG